MSRAARGQAGFTLAETLIAATVLGLAILAMTSLQITSIRGNIFSTDLMQGTYVAQDGLESLRNLPIDSPNLQAGSFNPGPVTISGVVFNRSYSVAANGNLKTIRYVVSWDDGKSHSLAFSTIRSQ